jgi:hypothetical protein
MSFAIHTTRYLSKEQLILLNDVAHANNSKAAQDPEILRGLDEGQYIVEQAKVSPDTQDTVRAKVLVNIGMIPSLWIEIPLADYRMLPTAEIPGDDTDWDSMPLEIQEQRRDDS